MNSPGVNWKNYLWIVVGTGITAFGINVFYLPNHLNDGGVTGLAILLHYLYRVPLGAGIVVLNVPLLLASIGLLGVGLGVRTIFGIAALAGWTQVLRIPPPTHDLLLGAVYGGLLSGLGLGLVFRSQGTTGGTDLAVRLLRHYFHLTMGQGLFILDLLVISATGAVLNLTLAMYSLFALFVAAKVVDIIQEDLDYSKAVWIVTEKGEEVAKEVMEDLGRGATAFPARGMYTGRDKDSILVVLSRSEISRLKNIVHRVDPGAFLVFTEAHEVVGEGFRPFEVRGKGR